MNNKLEKFLQSSNKICWIKSTEEKRVITDISYYINSINHTDIYTWSLISGIKQFNYTEQIYDLKEESTTFESLVEHYSTNKGLYFLCDLQLIIDRPNVIRGLKELVDIEPVNNNKIIIISSNVNIPKELEYLITVYDYETPTLELIETMLEMTLANIQHIETPNIEEIKYFAKLLNGFTIKEITEIIEESIKYYNKLNIESLIAIKENKINSSGVLSYETPTATLNDIGGNENFKDWFEEIKYCLTSQDFDDPIKGYLSLGIPGTSKTYTAEAIASELNVPFIKFDISQITSRYVGESEKNMDKALKIVQSCAPCVFLIDEVEKCLGGYSNSSSVSDGGAIARTFSKLLEFLNDSKDVLTVMTSNDISQLPPELTRAGRLDSIFYFSLPTSKEIEQIYNIHLRAVNYNINDMDKIIKSTVGYTGAEIKTIVKLAKRKAYVNHIKTNNDNIVTDDIMLQAIETVIPISKSYKEKIKQLEDWSKDRAIMANRQDIQKNKPLIKKKLDI